jgi:predicted transcriptional regulator
MFFCFFFVSSSLVERLICEEMGLGNYRGKLDIIADILRVVSQKPKKTQIMYQANLSYKVLKRYLRNVTAYSLISFVTEEQCYVLTPKGHEFLEAYQDYSRTNTLAKKHLNDVRSKKKSLEELCSNR